jgi:hypothetical protein
MALAALPAFSVAWSQTGARPTNFEIAHKKGEPPLMIGTLIVLQSITLAPLTPEAVQASPTAAARAVTADALPDMPGPVTVTLQCMVEPNGGLSECIPADDGGTRDAATHLQRFYAAMERAKADPVLAAALTRMRFYRVRSNPGTGKPRASVLVREVVSPADRAPQTPAVGAIPRGGVKLNFEPTMNMGDFYPPDATRSETRARVSATCRILGDLSLLCRNPEVDLQPTEEVGAEQRPGMVEGFGRSTLRVLASMRADPRTATGEDSVGRELPVTIVWHLP